MSKKISLLVAFGNFLINDRETKEKNPNQHDVVSDADIANFFEEENKKTHAPTLGEQRVQRNFNPTANQTVENLKSDYAALIDDLEAMKAEGKNARCLSVAQTELETSCMYAVKSIFA